MTQLWLPCLGIIIGFIGLVWSADRFVGGSAALAHRLGVPKLLVGLTIVAFGTSAPEIVVSISASLRNAGELAVGNALGSNLANMGLVLAITALVAPLPIHRPLLTREVPTLLVITALAGVTLRDGYLAFWEGTLLLLLLPAVLMLMIKTKRETGAALAEEVPRYGLNQAVMWFLVGLAVLVGSSEVLVWGASELALALGVPPLVVGLTVIALGTSLPELAASIVSALKGHLELALGNIIGSNLFNLLAVMAIPALIQQPQMEAAVFGRDYLAMAAVTFMLAGAIGIDYLLRHRTTRGEAPTAGRLGRLIGTLLLASYGGYYVWLFTSL
ncbi:calcium/sodium antiporter [Marinimicrobium locisalis]|uniref:calcium/sodium antiporter n=1 Tax=Marinimicrobium locisalis TaxID=546022 RepID=UPI0032215F33